MIYTRSINDRDKRKKREKGGKKVLPGGRIKKATITQQVIDRIKYYQDRKKETSRFPFFFK